MSVPQSVLSRHLSGMTSELALPGLELPREQGHMMTIPVLPPYLAPSLFVSCALYPPPQSVFKTSMLVSMPPFHR